MRTFLIADLHFDEENIMLYENRPFATVSEMNETMVKRWNETVEDTDTVFVLGDIGNVSYIKNLKGIKKLIKGNHDIYDNSFYRNHGFTECYDLPVVLENFFLLSHEPMYVNKNMPYANVYGHVHANPNYKTVSSHGYCVSVERIDYQPIDIEEVKKKMIAYEKEI